MSLLETIQTDIITAMKAKDSVKLATLRNIKQVLDKAIKEKAAPLTPEAEQKALETLVKQRKDSISQFEAGGRQDLADKEKIELAVLLAYLPTDASEIELDTAIRAAITVVSREKQVEKLDQKDMGLVMKATKDILTGKRADGKLLSEKIKSVLSMDATAYGQWLLS